MADNQGWLDVLQNATNYRELQSVFSQMAAEANATNDATTLAASIDEAIRRIEEERSRDKSELENFTAEYESFKQQQSGVIGWFKRKLPFTETRKQELEHRGTVGDQKAEILADNFVIARAQMLKERILQAPLRRMGNRPHKWRERLLQHDTVQEIRLYGSVAMELSSELMQSKVFVESVRVEIEAFSDAGFAEKEDRSRRDLDLLAARTEIKALDDENHEKESLRHNAVKRLGTLIQTELLASDPSFRTISERTDQLKEVVGHVSKTTKLVEERRSALATLVEKFGELESIPEKREAMQNSTNSLRRESENAEFRRSRAATDLIEPTNAYNAAVRDVNQSKAALDEAKAKHETFLAQQQTAEVTSDFEYGGTSSTEVEYERQKNDANRANDSLKRLTPSFESAKRQVAVVSQEADAIRKKLELQQKEYDSLVEKEGQLKKWVASSYENLQRTDPDFQQTMDRFSSLISNVSWLENHRFLVGVPSDVFDSDQFNRNANRDILPTSPSWARMPGIHVKSRELTEFQQQSASIERFAKTIQSDNDTLLKAYSQLTAKRKEALHQRCQLLLDGNLAKEIVFD